MMTPFCWMIGGVDQEKITSLSPAAAVNFCGAPDGAETESAQYVLMDIVHQIKKSYIWLYAILLLKCYY